MFGAPDTPRCSIYRQSPARRPGVGDHVCVCGGYVGLIVDIEPSGFATLARRHAPGRHGVIESGMLVDRLQIAPVTRIGFDEVVDRDWRRGTLG